MDKISRKDIILAALCLMSVRALFMEPSVGYAIFGFALVAALVADKYFEHVQKPDVALELKQELENIRTNVSGLMIKNATKPAQMQQEIKRFF